MYTAKVTKNISAAVGGGNVTCSILISIKAKAWLYSFLRRIWLGVRLPKSLWNILSRLTG